MPELLLEVGCEELPATFVRKAYSDLYDRVAAALSELYGGKFEGQALGTPRRLIVAFGDVPARQPDTTKELRGPALKAAYDADGNPTPALQGFCRSNGSDPSHLRRDDQYVWLTKEIAGLPTAELLAEALPKAIKGLTFEKSMRWGSSRLRFARPVRWLLAAFDGQTVAFEIEGVKSGLESRGHRFYAPDAFQATSLESLVVGLRSRKVEPTVERRADEIRAQANAVVEGTPDLPNDLVDENAFLCEWPTAIAGEFRTEHLALPAAVLTTAMAKHEKMFPVRDARGGLVNQFVFIRNSGEDDAVRAGAEWVLNARLDDAQFFYREDLKVDFDYFLEKTSGIVFQEKLGTVRERADRLEELCGYIAENTGAESAEIEFARQAGRYAKADLSTGLVSDMASLQGIVGGDYGKRRGLPDEVCHAIATHYDPSKNCHPESIAAMTAQRLSLADNLDKLVGFLSLGLVPSGSSDPFGLRRAATALIDIVWNWSALDVDYQPWFAKSFELYVGQSKPVSDANLLKNAEELFIGRYSALMSHVRHDVLEAATVPGHGYWSRPGDLPVRTAALELLAEDEAFVQTATRPLNIVAAAAKKGVAVRLSNQPSTLESEEGAALLSIVEPVCECIAYAIRNSDSVAAAHEAKKLAGPINKFMDATMIMVDDESVRTSRLSLLSDVGAALLQIGDFTKLVASG